MSVPLMDPRSESFLINLMPAFADELRYGHADFAAETQSFAVITSGNRTYAQQEIEWLKGRDAHGNVIPKGQPGCGTVTNAHGGYSNHNFGMAVDMEPDAEPLKPGFQPDWNTLHPHWAVLVRCMKARGIAWGGDWKNMKGDLDHFQFGGTPATPTQSDRNAFTRGGMKAVWSLYSPKVNN